MNDSKRLDWIMERLQLVARSASAQTLMTLAIKDDWMRISATARRKKEWRKAIDEAAAL